MAEHLTARSLLIWIGTLDDLDAPILVEDAVTGFTTLRTTGSLRTPDCNLTLKRQVPVLGTPAWDPDRTWRQRRAEVVPLLRKLGELEGEALAANLNGEGL